MSNPCKSFNGRVSDVYCLSCGYNSTEHSGDANASPSRKLAPSNSKSEDTSLDKLLIIALANLMIGKEYPNVGKIVDTAIPILKEQQAKLLQVIEDEVVGKDEPDWDGGWTEEMADSIRETRRIVYGRNRLKAEQRQAIKQIKERL